MASKAFEAGVRKLFAPRLAELGFVRHGVRYHRPRLPLILHAIDLQQNKYNGSGYARFTINLARTLIPTFSRETMRTRAKTRKSLFGPGTNWVRMGHVTEVGEDYWYAYDPDDAASVEAALNEALADIERYGLFWLRWGFRRPGVRRDPARAIAARARFDAFVAQLSANTTSAD